MAGIVGVRAADVPMGQITLAMLGTGTHTNHSFANGTFTLEAGYIYRFEIAGYAGATGGNAAPDGGGYSWKSSVDGTGTNIGHYRTGPSGGANGAFARGFYDAREKETDIVVNRTVSNGASGASGGAAFTFSTSVAPGAPTTQRTMYSGNGGAGGAGISLSIGGTTVISARGGNGGQGQTVMERVNPGMNSPYNTVNAYGGAGGNGGGATSIAGMASISGSSATYGTASGASGYITVTKWSAPIPDPGNGGENPGGGNGDNGGDPGNGNGGEGNGGEGNGEGGEDGNIEGGGNEEGGNGGDGEGGENPGNGGENPGGGDGDNGDGGNGGENPGGENGNGEEGENPPYFGNNKTNWILFWIPIIFLCTVTGAGVGAMIWLAVRENRVTINDEPKPTEPKPAEPKPNPKPRKRP